jgi:drug/metabolite transporter (DMT)-like permease
MRPSAPVAYALLAVAAFLWAGNSVAGRALAGDVSPLGLAFWRWTLALPILYFIVRAELRAQWPIVRAHWKRLTLLALLSAGPNHALVYWGLHYTSAINVQLFNSTIPIWVVLIQWVFLALRPTRAESAGVIVSLVGVLLILTAGYPLRLFALDLNFGDLIILATFLGWSVYAVLLRFRPAELSPFAFVFTTACIGILAIAPFYAIELMLGHGLPPAEPRVWGWILFIALGSSVFAAAFHSAGVDRIGPARASLFLHLIPVFGVGMAIAILGEAFAWYHAVGFVLVLAGLGLANRARPAERADRA